MKNRIIVPKKKKIIAIRDFVIIRPDRELKTSTGMIVIPDSAQDEKNPLSGVVISVGCGLVEGGQIIPLKVKVGDHVAMPPHSGTLFKDHPVFEDAFVIRENQIFGYGNDPEQVAKRRKDG